MRLIDLDLCAKDMPFDQNHPRDFIDNGTNLVQSYRRTVSTPLVSIMAFWPCPKESSMAFLSVSHQCEGKGSNHLQLQLQPEGIRTRPT